MSDKLASFSEEDVLKFSAAIDALKELSAQGYRFYFPFPVESLAAVPIATIRMQGSPDGKAIKN